MPKASELKKGDVIDIGGAPHIASHIESRSPSARGSSTLYKVRFHNLITGHKLDETYKGDVFLTEAQCERVGVQFSYVDGEQHIFMNTSNYAQYGLNSDAIEDQLYYLSEGLEGITALLVEDRIVAIDLPQSVVMEIVDTTPGIKGATATARSKPATLTTGLVVQVPEYLEQGEMIKVNTTNGKFMSRA